MLCKKSKNMNWAVSLELISSKEAVDFYKKLDLKNGLVIGMDRECLKWFDKFQYCTVPEPIRQP